MAKYIYSLHVDVHSLSNPKYGKPRQWLSVDLFRRHKIIATRCLKSERDLLLAQAAQRILWRRQEEDYYG